MNVFIISPRKIFFIIFSFCFLSCSFFVYSQTTAKYDTIFSKYVGPGMIFSKVIETTKPWSINILEVDLKNPYLKLETVKANDLMAGGRETVSSMAARRNFVKHWSVGAVNGDFFDLSTGATNNLQVLNGEVIKKERPGYAAIGFDTTNKVFLSRPSVGGSIYLHDTTVNIDGYNEPRSSGKIVLYNKYFGPSTGTNSNGAEIVINPVNGWIVNDTIACVVSSKTTGTGNILIPDGAAVVSGDGSAGDIFSAKVEVGDTIKIYQKVTNALPDIKEIIGGHPIVVQDGALAPIDPNDPLLSNKHPRTLVGINKDTTKLFLIVVDGRQSSSVGMDVYDMVDYMTSIGIYQGMNFDGGGSSTMIVRGSLVNNPSDGSQRADGNSLLLVSTAPLGPLAKLNLSPHFSKVFTGKKQQITIEPTDNFYNPVQIDQTQLHYFVDSSLGKITANGLFTAGTSADTGYVFAFYNKIKDSVKIIVKGVDHVDLSPEQAVTDARRIVIFNAKVFDTDNVQQDISSSNFTWTLTNPEIGKIDNAGQFQGVKPGESKVIVEYKGKFDTSDISVQIGSGVALLDSMENLNNWNMTSEFVDSSTALVLATDTLTFGSHSFRIDYSFTFHSGEYNWVHLNTDIPIYGLPDSLFIDVRSDGKNHRVFFDVVDAVGKPIRIFTKGLANVPNVFVTMKAPVPMTSSIVFPLTLKAISIPLGSGMEDSVHYAGAIYLDNLRTSYPQNATGIESNKNFIPQNFELSQNYPNPFNPTTRINYKISSHSFVQLKVFDILGNEVITLVDKAQNPGNYSIRFNGRNLASGIYIYRLTAGSFSSSRKFVLLK